MSRSRRCPVIARKVLAVACAAAALNAGCDEVDLEFGTPASTYKTYVKRVLADDPHGVWECFAGSYRASQYGGNYETWKSEWRRTESDLKRAARRREIVEERPIGDRIGFLRFDASTLPSEVSPHFFYFIRDPDGWKVTTYLDSTFHGELEAAIERGEFELLQL